MKTKKLPLGLLSAVIISLMLSGCATIFTGTTDKIKFNTEPAGATVYIDGIEQCTTPCTVKVHRSVNDKEALFKLDGYETRYIVLSKEFNLVSILNLENLFGWGIDLLTGSIVKYDQRVYDIRLDEGGTMASTTPARIEIDTDGQTVDIFAVQN
ncbi:MAG: PEGA domain-containing protein [Bacteroidales bacterium]|nr:PEGA domain-containing protein [Bacteroidales bacterium]